MKKLIVTAILLGGMTVLLQAQNMDFGLKGGYMYSEIELDIENKDINSDYKNGYYIGAFARIGDKWFFQPEIQYRVRKGEIAETEKISEIELKTLDFPIQVGRQLFKVPTFKLAVHAGPVLSFKLDDNSKVMNLEVGETVKDFESAFWGGQIGISADFWKISADITYEKGFTDLAEGLLGKNDLIFLSVGFKIL